MRIVKRILKGLALLIAVLVLLIGGYIGLEVARYGSDSTYLGFVMQMYSGWKAVDTVEQGDMAPDFALVPLRDYDFGIDATVFAAGPSQDGIPRVRLSEFRGEKPVALIFGSYT